MRAPAEIVTAAVSVLIVPGSRLRFGASSFFA